MLWRSSVNSRPIFRPISVTTLVLLLLPMLAFARPSTAQTATIETTILRQLARQDEASIWIVLNEQADLSPAYAIRDWERRGRFIYDRLQAVAKRSQAGLLGMLQRRGVVHRSFFIHNTIQARVDNATLRALARRPEVRQSLAEQAYRLPKLLPGRDKAPCPNGYGTERRVEPG